MTDRHGQRIGDILRFHVLFEPRQRAHHALHLVLFRAAITDHAVLHFERRIFSQRDARLGDGQQGDAAHVRQPQRGPDILRIEHFFYRGCVGPVLGQDAAQRNRR